MKARIGIAFILLFALVIAGWLLLRSRDGSSTGGGAGGGGAGGIAGEGYTVAGRVVGPEAEHIRGASVTAAGREQLSDPDGFFRFSGLAAGEVTLDASAEGYVSPGPAGIRGLRLTLAGDEDGARLVDGIELTLRRPGQLRGRVVAGAEPVSAQLSLSYAGAAGLSGPLEPFYLDGVGDSGADGAFLIEGVAPGRLRVVAEAEEFAVAESRELYLGDGETIADIVIDLLPSGVVRGMVRDPEGAGIAAAEVVASGPGLARSLRTRSDASGRFGFDALPAGLLGLRARASGYRSAAPVTVEVVAGEPRQAELRLEPASGLFGRVIDVDEEGVSLAYVVLGMGGRFQVLRTDPEGYFDWAQAPDRDMEATGISPRHGASPTRKVRPGNEVLLRVGPGGFIAGKVVDPKGAPVSRFTVAVESFKVEGYAPYNNRAFRPEAVSRSDGNFELGPLRPGSYHLRAVAPGYARGGAGPIEVRADHRTGGVVIKLGRGSVVSGTVSGPDGKPVAGAKVTLFDPLGSLGARSVSSNRDGDYQLRGVPAGRRSLKVTAPRYLTEIAAGLDVPEGGELWRDITLERAPRGGGFSFHGIGAVLRDHEEGVQVMQTMDGHPASAHGLRAGDVIVEVDRELTTDMRLDQVIERIRGEAGVPVELEVERAGEGRFTVELERGRVVVNER